MLLRDFLYVDSDKVRGLLAQLDEGIVESSSAAETQEKSSELGLRGLAEHSQRWGSERTVQKSLGDALFPTLEQALEAIGLLADLSTSLTREDFWGAEMREQHPPGSLVRITAPAALFDARYLAATFAQFATSWQGLVDIDVLQSAPPVSPSPPGKGGQRKGASSGQRRKPTASADEPRQLEDSIPDVELNFEGTVVPRSFLQGVVRLARACSPLVFICTCSRRMSMATESPRAFRRGANSSTASLTCSSRGMGRGCRSGLLSAPSGTTEKR